MWPAKAEKLRFYPRFFTGSLPLSGPRYRFGLGKGPLSVQDFFLRRIHTDRIVPPRCDRDTVKAPVVAATEVQGKRTIRVWLGGDVVIAVNIAFIGLKVALRVIHSDGPESVHWHVHYVQEIGRAAIIVVVLPLNTPLAAVLAPKLMSGFIEPLHHLRQRVPPPQKINSRNQKQGE